MLVLNNSALNRAAWRLLKEVRQPVQQHYLLFLQLADWGLENGAEGDWPERDRYALNDQVNLLFAWKPENVVAWLFSNPNGPDDNEEQTNCLLLLLQSADEPLTGAAHVLSAIYNRQVSENTALQSASTIGGD